MTTPEPLADDAKEQLVFTPLPGYVPEIGLALAMLADSRRRTLRAVNGLDPRCLDWIEGGGNSLGSLLYHIAAIEMDWLFTEVMEGTLEQAVWDAFPHPVRDINGRLTLVTGVELAAHLKRLQDTREHVLAVFQPMTLADYRRPRPLVRYDVSPEWVLNHLMQHEAEHRGEILTTRTMAERALGI
jgi:uncharacterized damage-inducible protein DinB